MIGKYLKSEGFNLRERLNIYTSMALGPVIGTGLMYSLLNNAIEPEGPGGYALKVGIAAIMNLPFILSELSGGAAIGILESTRLCNQRLKKETKFDKKINQEFTELNGTAV
jgi:hypothetical protein